VTSPYAGAAREILDSMRAMYSKPFTLVDVREEDFPHLDLAPYARARADLESRGFRYLGDLEVLEVSNAPHTFLARTMCRTLVSADGGTVGGYFQMRPRIGRVLRSVLKGLLNLRWIDSPMWAVSTMTPRHCSDFETELSDGSFLCTSNTEGAAPMSNPPSIDDVFFPYGTAVGLLLKAHERRLQARLQQDPRVSVVTHHNLDDVKQMMLRLQAQKNAYRATLQWVSRDEMRALSTNTNQADEVFAEVQRQLREGPPQ
jgi:hypothetical protein